MIILSGRNGKDFVAIIPEGVPSNSVTTLILKDFFFQKFLHPQNCYFCWGSGKCIAQRIVKWHYGAGSMHSPSRWLTPIPAQSLASLKNYICREKLIHCMYLLVRTMEVMPTIVLHAYFLLKKKTPLPRCFHLIHHIVKTMTTEAGMVA